MKSSKISFLLAALALAMTAACSLTVDLPDNASGQPDGSITIPLAITEQSVAEVRAYKSVITFDPRVLHATGASSEGTLSGVWGAPAVDLSEAGRIVVGGFGPEPLQGYGALVNLHFDVVGQPADTTDLKFEHFIFNLDTPRPVLSHGKFKVVQ